MPPLPKPLRPLTTFQKKQLDDKKLKEHQALISKWNPKGLKLSGYEDNSERTLKIIEHYLAKGNWQTFKPLLPAYLSLKGKPYTLDNHFPFEPLFRTRLPKKSLFKTGRQLAKSTSLAAQGIVFHASIPFFSTLYVTPLFEMIRRFSQNYVRPFIEMSPVRRLLTDPRSVNSVLQRSFRNHSKMQFSFAYLDADRTRGIAADQLIYDEVQDIVWDFLDIIQEVLSGSVDWGLQRFAGTPKSLDNTIEKLWTESSQAEFMIKCHAQGCGHWNVPALAYDLEAMTGKVRDEISPKSPGITCAKCRKPVFPRIHGRWIHGDRTKRWEFPGYHIPQIVMPMHNENVEKYSVLYGKSIGRGSTPRHVYLNEVCGESCDLGAKVVNLTELTIASCLPWRNTYTEAVHHIGNYQRRVIGIDWGGNGGRSALGRIKTSFTVVSVLGMLPNGKVDVIWAHRIIRSLAFEHEVQVIIAAFKQFECSHIGHDYGGAGAEREHLLLQAGFPRNRIFPMQYHGQVKGAIMLHKKPTPLHRRNWFSLDRSKSLGLICHCIRAGLLRFFQPDFVSSEDPGLIRDFLSLQEEKIERPQASDVYYITRNPNLQDDFVHSVNFGACLLWFLQKKWPNLAAQMDRYQLPDEDLGQLNNFDVPEEEEDLSFLDELDNG